MNPKGVLKRLEGESDKTRHTSFLKKYMNF